jgi:hypothetical protein
MSIVPYERERAVIQREFNLNAQTANTILSLVNNGMPLIQAISNYVTNLDFAAIRERVTNALQRITEPDPGYVQLVQEQGRRGELGGPDIFDRLRNPVYDISNDNIMETTISATGQGTHTRFIDPEDINPGMFILQFAT